MTQIHSVVACGAMELNYNATNELTRTERLLVGVCENINEKSGPKKLQKAFHNSFGRHLIRLCSSNLLRIRGFENVKEVPSDAGVLLCSNHRSFFDMYMISSILRNNQPSWFENIYFPVRSNFFYDKWSGLAVNLAISGGAMYPPIFRDKNRSDLNRIAVNRLVEILKRPGSVVGMHPEGKRGTGDDPYEVLGAKPGVGQMALRSKATVLPIWVSGMGNDFAKQVTANFRPGGTPVRVTFGKPMDLRDMHGDDHDDRKIQLEAANRIMGVIHAMGLDEKARLSASSN